MKNKMKTKPLISSHEAAKIIQPAWNHKKLCDLLIELEYIKSPTEKFENSSSNIRLSYSKYDTGEKIYFSEFSITEDFLKILVAGFKKLKKETDIFFTSNEVASNSKSPKTKIQKSSEDRKEAKELTKNNRLLLRTYQRRIKLLYG